MQKGLADYHILLRSKVQQAAGATHIPACEAAQSTVYWGLLLLSEVLQLRLRPTGSTIIHQLALRDGRPELTLPRSVVSFAAEHDTRTYCCTALASNIAVTSCPVELPSRKCLPVSLQDVCLELPRSQQRAALQ